MGLLSRRLTRQCTPARLLFTVVLLCVCSLILMVFSPGKSDPTSFVSLQDSLNERRSEGVTEAVDPLVHTKVLEEPAKHLEEDLWPVDSGVWSPVSTSPPGGVVDEYSQFTEEDPNAAWTLNSTSLETRGKHQRLAMKSFCSQHPTLSAFPRDGTYQSWELYKHLLYNDEKKIIFCYIPKIGCSNWKRMFAVLQNLTVPTNPKQRPPESVLSEVDNMYHLSPSEREMRLKSYFKFVMIRNPFERIVSVYRNKIAPPFMFEHRRFFPDKEKYYIMRNFEASRFHTWWSSSREESISPSFNSFLKFLTVIHGRRANEHLQPMLDLCHPCAVDYDAYISFKNLPDDAFKVLDMFDIPHEFYRNVENHPEYTTSGLVELYFGNMNEAERREIKDALNAQAVASINDSPPSSPPQSVIQSLLDAYEDELDFYFALHPEERNVYLRLLGLHVSA